MFDGSTAAGVRRKRHFPRPVRRSFSGGGGSFPRRLSRRRPGEGGSSGLLKPGRPSRPVRRLVRRRPGEGGRPVCPSQHGIHRHHHQGVKGREGRPLLGRQCCFPLSRRRNDQDCAITRSLPPRGAAIVPNGPSAGMARSSNAPRFGLEFAEAGAILALG